MHSPHNHNAQVGVTRAPPEAHALTLAYLCVLDAERALFVVHRAEWHALLRAVRHGAHHAGKLQHALMPGPAHTATRKQGRKMVKWQTCGVHVEIQAERPHTSAIQARLQRRANKTVKPQYMSGSEMRAGTRQTYNTSVKVPCPSHPGHRRTQRSNRTPTSRTVAWRRSRGYCAWL